MKIFKMKIFCFAGLLLIIPISLFFIACSSTEHSRVEIETPHAVVVSASGVDAEGPFFTKDHQGNPVLVWSEKLKGDVESGYVMKFSKFSVNGDEIIQTGAIPPSRGCSTTSESMNKLAFKNDGTIVSVYARRSPTEANRFAGALYYSVSSDEGQTWSPEKYLHVGDTSAGLSRSFFDLATLPDGEVGAIWLDSRMKSSGVEGSTLYFAKTHEDRGFLADQPIGFGSCECCRTELFVAENGSIHALYRSILQDSIRDIVHIISDDNGESFSDPTRISHDNWVIYGCPHTGPSMAESSAGIEITWFTMGTTPGVYHTMYDENTQSYSKKELLTPEGRHPQVVSLGQERWVALWEESGLASGHEAHMDHGLGSFSSDDLASPKSVITAELRPPQSSNEILQVSDSAHFAELPVGIGLEDGAVGVAWLEEGMDGVRSVMYRRMNY